MTESGCSRNKNRSERHEDIESRYKARPYGECLQSIDSGADNAGYLYHIAFYKAIDADSLAHYAAFLDSATDKHGQGKSRHYVASLRLLSHYLLGSADYDSLKRGILAMEPCPDTTQEEVFAHAVAKTMVGSDAPAAWVMQLRAVEAMRHGGRYRPSEVLSQAALICSNLGDYHTAMHYLNEAADTLSAQGWPKRETVYMLGNKASLYRSLEMLDSALRVNTEALRVAEGDVSLTADLLASRGLMFAEAMRTDSAKASLEKAERIMEASRLPYAPMFLRYIRARKGVLAADDPAADESALKEAAKDLEASFGDRASVWEEKFAYGKVMFRLGDRKGLDVMRAAMDSMGKYHEPRILLWSKRNIINACLECGRQQEAARQYGEAFALVDSIKSRQARYLAIAKEIEYSLREHERENQLLNRVHRQDQSKILWLAIAVGLALALLVWAGVFIVLNRRLNRKDRMLNSHRIMMLIENRKERNRCIGELQDESEANGLDWAALTPSSMSAKDTALFRKSFISLYPDFLTRLHELCPELTANDENLCMLIKIGQSSDDIALALGISKPSVNSARYRIRRKMRLGKDVSLNDVIAGI